MVSNSQLVGLRNGDISAFEEIFSVLYKRLCSFAMNYVNTKDDVEEIVEDVMVMLWNKREDFEHANGLKSYLYKSVRNACFDLLKKRKDHISLNQVSEELLFHKESFDQLLIKEEVHTLLYNALNTLPEKCRKVFELSCIEGVKYQDIAEDLGITINTVKSQRARAIKLLQSQLKLSPYFILYMATMVY